MYKTSYLRAKNLDEAGRILADAEDGRLLAGGMTLLPTLKQRLAAAEQLIDLADCGPGGIAAEEGGFADRGDDAPCGCCQFRAGARHYSGPRPAGSGIGDRQVRNRGTIGGSLANNDPSACCRFCGAGAGRNHPDQPAQH